jgi:hypothetical protein
MIIGGGRRLAWGGSRMSREANGSGIRVESVLVIESHGSHMPC